MGKFKKFSSGPRKGPKRSIGKGERTAFSEKRGRTGESRTSARPSFGKKPGRAGKPERGGFRKSEGSSERSFRPRSTEDKPFSLRDRKDSAPSGRRSEGSTEKPFRPYKSKDRPYSSDRKERSPGTGRFEKSSERPFRARRDDNKPFTPRDRKPRAEGSAERPFRPRRDDDKPFASRDRKERPEGSAERPFRPRRDDDKPFPPRDRKERPEGSAERPFRPRREDDKPFAPRERKERFPKAGKAEDSEARPFRERREDDRPFVRRERDDRPVGKGDKDFTRPSGRPLRPRKNINEERPETDSDETARPEKESRENTDVRSERPYTPRRRDDRPDTRRPAPKGWGHDARPRTDEKPERKWNKKEDHEFYGDRKKSNSFGKKKSSRPSTTAADEGLTRLNKYIANAGICSRREADDMIEAGVITVNGEVITEMGYKVKAGDIVKYNNSTLRGEKLVYLLINKPKDFITTTDDPEERKTVMSLITNACKERVYPVGRLDRNTTGVLLMTNDGDLARKLTHPSFEVQKVYQVELDKALKASEYQEIAEGIKLDDGFIKVDDIAYVGTGSDKAVVGVELHSGKNHIVRRIFEHFGYRIKKLDRVIFAGLTKKDLPRGRWRFLTPLEVASLKMMTGSKKFVGAE